MDKAREHLENIQGLLIYLKAKNGVSPSLKELVEKQNNDPEFFKIIFEDYLQNHSIILENFLIQKDRRTKQTYEKTILDTAKKFKDSTNEELEIELKKTSDYLLDLISILPTKYQEFYSFSTTHHLLQDTIEAAIILGYKFNELPIIGTVSNESINIGTFTLENGEPIIIVDEDYLAFIHLLSKIFAQCLPFEGKGIKKTLIARKQEIEDNIINNPQIQFHFKDLIKSILKGSPRNAKVYELPYNERYMFCTYLMLSAEYFAIGHEIGHILKHHDKSRFKFWCFGKECSNSINDEADIDKEYEADFIGMNIAIQAMRKHNFDIDFCYIGIECFFIVNDIALKAKKLKEKGNEDISDYFKDHPSNLKRKQKLREQLKKMLPIKEVKNAFFMPDIIDETMSFLWNHSKGDFT